jgi:hypothetical protein
MGIFQKINSWFKKETEEFKLPEEVEAEKRQEAINKPVIKETEGNYGNRIEECDWCKDPIETYQKRKTFNGKKYHKNCYKTLYRLCRKEAGI